MGKGTAVIIPAYNEEKHIREVIRRVKHSVPKATIIVVSDGSKDRTVKIASDEGVIVIDNNKILEFSKNLPVFQALNKANEIISNMIVGIVETINQPQTFKNLDFQDIKTVMESGGVSIVGIGEASGSRRAKEAIDQALQNPLLDVNYEGAKGALIYLEGDNNLTMEEMSTVMEEVYKHLGEDSELVIGARINEKLNGTLRVIVIISVPSSILNTGTCT